MPKPHQRFLGRIKSLFSRRPPPELRKPVLPKEHREKISPELLPFLESALHLPLLSEKERQLFSKSLINFVLYYKKLKLSDRDIAEFLNNPLVKNLFKHHSLDFVHFLESFAEHKIPLSYLTLTLPKYKELIQNIDPIQSHKVLLTLYHGLRMYGPKFLHPSRSQNAHIILAEKLKTLKNWNDIFPLLREAGSFLS